MMRAAEGECAVGFYARARLDLATNRLIALSCADTARVRHALARWRREKWSVPVVLRQLDAACAEGDRGAHACVRPVPGSEKTEAFRP